MGISLPVLKAVPPPPPEPVEPEALTFEDLAAAVDQAVSQVQMFESPELGTAMRMKDAIEAFHKYGLTKIVQKLKSDPRGKELLFDLVDDPGVYALFVLHGLVKSSLTTRVVQVLETIKPYMQSHGGDVELDRVEDRTVFVKLHGACLGCSHSAVTLREGVEEALKTRIPEITGIEVVPNDPGPALIQLGNGSPASQHGWIEGPRVEDVSVNSKQVLQAGDTPILLVNVDNRLSAFHNVCPHQGLPLDGGMFDPEGLELTCPWHGFRFHAATGECLTVPQVQLESFPLRVENGRIFVRPN